MRVSLHIKLAEFRYTEALNILCRIGLPNIVVAKKDLYVGAAKIICLNSFLTVCFIPQGQEIFGEVQYKYSLKYSKNGQNKIEVPVTIFGAFTS